MEWERRIGNWEGVREGKDVGDEVTKAFWSAEEGLRIGKDLGEDTKVFWSEEEELRIGKDVGEDTNVFWSRGEGLETGLIEEIIKTPSLTNALGNRVQLKI